MQKNIFKKIASGLCATAMSFGICLAGGPEDPSQKILIDIIVDYTTKNVSYTRSAPFESIESSVKNRLKIYAESLVNCFDETKTLTPDQKQIVIDALFNNLTSQFAGALTEEVKLMLDTPVTDKNLTVANKKIWEQLKVEAERFLKQNVDMPVLNEGQNPAKIQSIDPMSQTSTNEYPPIGIVIRSFNTPVDKLKTNFDTETTSICVHFCVKGKEVHVLLPPTITTDHCGGILNRHHLTIMIIESENLQYNESGSMITSQPAELTLEQTKYYEETYKSTVKLAALLAHNFEMDLSKKLTIIGHCEAHQLTPNEIKEFTPVFCFASNMATPNHVFPLFGLSMDQFRQDVQDQVNYWTEHGLSEHEKKLIEKMFADVEPYTVQ